MEKKSNGIGFLEGETVEITQWDKRENRWVSTTFPKISGRLRLAHNENEKLSITTEILLNDGNCAVIAAKTETVKGIFTGIGTASTERDKNVASAILELAETRAIARSLRFAGYGMEYCSAEEVSHLKNEDAVSTDSKMNSENKKKSDDDSAPRNGRDRGDKSSQIPGNDNDSSGRLSKKQLDYIITLGKSLGVDLRELDNQSIAAFGVKFGQLTKKDASTFIDKIRDATRSA